MNASILIACCRPLTANHWAAKLQATPYFYFVRSGLANVQVWILRPEPMPLLNGVPKRIGLIQLVQ